MLHIAAAAALNGDHLIIITVVVVTTLCPMAHSQGISAFAGVFVVFVDWTACVHAA
jgi:hypothetical protein